MSGASVCLFVDGDGRIFPKCSSVRKVFRKSNHEKEGAAAPSYQFWGNEESKLGTRAFKRGHA